MTRTTKITKTYQEDGPGVTINTSIDQVIDSYYLHISNSGIHINSLENTYISSSKGYTGPKECRNDEETVYKSWKLEYNLGSFGSDLKTTFNLQTAEQCDVLISVISKIKGKLLEHYGPTGRDQYDSLSPSRPSIIDGYKTEEVYGPVEGDDRNGGKDLLGYNLVAEDGVIVSFIKNEVEGRGRYWACSENSEDSTDESSLEEQPPTLDDINLLKNEGKLSEAEAEFLIGQLNSSKE